MIPFNKRLTQTGRTFVAFTKRISDGRTEIYPAKQWNNDDPKSMLEMSMEELEWVMKRKEGGRRKSKFNKWLEEHKKAELQSQMSITGS
jgi:hypothetical protein